MKYVFQVFTIILLIMLERYTTKTLTKKIKNRDAYKAGVFRLHELTGDKAITMYKINIFVARIAVVLTVISIIIIDVIG